MGRGPAHRRRAAARRARQRHVGTGLLGFGLAGLIVLAGVAAVIIGTLGPLEGAVRDIEHQRMELVALLDDASEALRQTGTASANASVSLRESAAAAREGAALTTDMATAFEQLALVSGVSVFGTQPFADLGTGFSQVADRARTLSSNLTATAESLATNETDASTAAEDLGRLADRLDTLGLGLGARAEAFEAIWLVRIVLLGLLAWLAVPAFAALWLGWRWTRLPAA